jgi:DNA polymerase-3 subunit alpha
MWTSLKNHSHYSLLRSLSKPIQIVERAAQIGITSLALTDINSVAGSVEFIEACKDKKIKPILGMELLISEKEEEKYPSRLTLIAKNNQGWKKLISIISAANSKDNFCRYPRLSFNQLTDYIDGNVLAMAGQIGTTIANSLFSNYHFACRENSTDEVKKFINKESIDNTILLVEKYRDLFGKDNFFIEIEQMDKKEYAPADVVANGMRYISEKTSVPCVAIADSYYPTQDDQEEHKILLCSKLNATFQTISNKSILHEDILMTRFSRSLSANFHIPSLQQIQENHTENEIKNSLLISDMCESYSILGKPVLPIFKGPNGIPPDQYIKKLCIDGWYNKIEDKIPQEKIREYKDRIKMELKVIQEAGLSSYFLIVQEYINYARQCGDHLSPGRGSGAGCLISYLLGITSVDPIVYNLSFARFYNAGRNTKDHVSLPDIDCDFPIHTREDKIDYIIKKHGRDKVSQMITFSRLQGRSALREVFRSIFTDVTFDEVTKITDHIPDEAEIADELQEMKESGEEPSIIMWALENNKKELKEYCQIDENGDLQGTYKSAFYKAIKIEGTKKSQGKHAAGVVISAVPLADIVPMVYDKSSKQQIVGMDMRALDKMGIPKFDILGIALLSKVMAVKNLLAKGAVN